MKSQQKLKIAESESRTKNIYSMKLPTDAAICSKFYSTARFTLHVSGVLHYGLYQWL